MSNHIYPCIWFDSQAKEAAEFYCSVFNGKIITDTPIVVDFELNDQKFMGLNGGPRFKVNPSVSFYVVIEDEGETEQVWNKLLEGGSALMPLDKYEWSSRYGWVQDRYGVSWQISFGKLADVGQKFTPTLMFTGDQHGRAEEAIQFYTSVFDNSTLKGILHYTGDEGEPAGTVKHAQFTINNYVMMAMDSSFPHAFAFNEAMSMVVSCETQNEVDYYWNKFAEGGEESMCGWVRDKFGFWWQVVPSILGELMADPERAPRVMNAFMQMRKFDIEKLLKA